MTRRILTVALLAACGAGAAYAKLPAPDDAAKAKAAETAARAAWQAKVDAFQLCKSQDKVAAAYRKTAGKPAAPAAAASKPSVAASGTPAPAAAAAPAPCVDPGPFAYTPPEQKPLEAAGAHSPPGTAASPPNVKPEAAKMAPAAAGASAPAKKS